jgi:hypothetical protein
MHKIIILSLLFITSCSSAPKILPNTQTDYRLTCKQIKTEVASLQEYRKKLEESDRFSMKNMLIVPAIKIAFTKDKNQKKIDARVNHLRKAYVYNGCSQRSGQNPNYYQ